MIEIKVDGRVVGVLKDLKVGKPVEGPVFELDNTPREYVPVVVVRGLTITEAEKDKAERVIEDFLERHG
jgi:hypothetical protein